LGHGEKINRELFKVKYICQVYVFYEVKNRFLAEEFQSEHARPDHLEVAGFRVVGECRVVGTGAGALDDLEASVGAVGGGDDGAFEVIGAELAGA
jgi:hypothetical protein